MSRNYVFSKNSFSFLITDFDKYWTFLKENITLIIIVLSLLGGLNQIVNFLLLSPDLIVYYSPSQGILDGVLFLILVLLTLSLLFGYGLLSIWVAETQKIVYKWITYVSAMFFCISFFLHLAVYLHQFWFAVWLVVPFYVLSHIFTSKPDEVKTLNPEEKYVKENHEKKTRNDRDIYKFRIILIIYFSLFAFIAYVSIFHNLHKNSVENIENSRLLESKINGRSATNFKLVYNNGKYVFLKDQVSSRITIVAIDEFTKNY